MVSADVLRQVTVEISEDGRHLDVRFDYDFYLVQIMRGLKNGRFLPADKGGPLWRFTLDVDLGKRLRRELGSQFVPGEKYKRWAMRQIDVATTLRTLSAGESAELTQLPDELPELWEALYLGPVGKQMTDDERKKKMEEPGSFQTADVAFMATAEFPINANHPGTGKTLEAIAAVFEQGLEDGPKLVIAPLTSLETVWEEELLHWQYQDVICCYGGKEKRLEAVEAAKQYIAYGEAFWFVTNPATLQMQATYEEDPVTGKRTGKRKLWAKHPELYDILWNAIILDEFQKLGLANGTLTGEGMNRLKKRKGFALSGTPIKGKPINLWGILHWLDPDTFPRKWDFADQWLVVSQGAYGKQIGDVRREREEDFWEMIGRYMIRRTKEEVLPWLPPKERIDVWAEMDPKQKKQYDIFAENAEIAIEEQNMSATSILAEYTRLKQFAFSAQTIHSIKDPPYYEPHPTEFSGKIPHVEEILSERGIISGKGEDDTTWEGEQVIIFSQFTRVVDFFEKYLKEKHNVRTVKITGAVAGGKRAEVQRQFQSDDPNRPQVMLMNTMAGGVSITLDNANTVIFLDETWVPDDQEQAEDRAHRASRIHQVTVYTIRCKGTIEEYIFRRVRGKDSINQRILDLRRQGLKATTAGRTVKVEA